LDSFLQGSLFERCVAISDETHRFRDWPSDESGLSDAARSGPRVPTGLAQAAYELTWNSSNFWPGSASLAGSPPRPRAARGNSRRSGQTLAGSYRRGVECDVQPRCFPRGQYYIPICRLFQGYSLIRERIFPLWVMAKQMYCIPCTKFTCVG